MWQIGGEESHCGYRGSAEDKFNLEEVVSIRR
jgi:hypothetical protein